MSRYAALRICIKRSKKPLRDPVKHKMHAGVTKTDVAKYFDSIDHDILLNLLEKKVKDKTRESSENEKLGQRQDR